MTADPGAAFAAACARVPPETLAVVVAGVAIQIRVAGPALAARLFEPVRHIASTCSNAEVTIDIDAWGIDETGVPLPPGQLLEESDTTRRRLVCAFPGVDSLTRLSMARPFQAGLLPLLARLGRPAVHGGVIARGPGEPGLLLVGPNGSGKSTTCLAALLAGFRLVGEDCLAVTRNGALHEGHSMYRSCCLTVQSQAMFRHLPGDVRRPLGAPTDAKGVMLLPCSANSDMMLRTAPIRALVLPVLGESGRPRLARAGTAETLRRFMPGLRFMRHLAPEDRRAQYDALTALVHDLPSYRLELGDGVAGVPDLLFDLADSLR
ncbi:MAG: hypothetical protein V4610_04715 [Pseudomonadota bacterium]|jgi:hypothetical protein|uniref:Serine kinase of the HPr protein, regulates carbohydrate metabolism n=1 Tax=hydrothermal vent metagenome TaxID=652676 RepID=A0A160TIE7_9ZZZZ